MLDDLEALPVVQEPVNEDWFLNSSILHIADDQPVLDHFEERRQDSSQLFPPFPNISLFHCHSHGSLSCLLFGNFGHNWHYSEGLDLTLGQFLIISVYAWTWICNTTWSNTTWICALSWAKGCVKSLRFKWFDSQETPRTCKDFLWLSSVLVVISFSQESKTFTILVYYSRQRRCFFFLLS